MLLQLKNIVFTFAGKNHLLNDISLSFNENKVYALMGSNGVGKTTLFNLITGYIKPHSGEIIFKNENLIKLKPHQINKRGIGRTFQDLRLITKLTVKENILLAMDNNPTDNWMKALLPQTIYKDNIKLLEEKTDEIVSEFFLDDVADSLAGEISYGQQKLLNLACCVANGASLLLLDEPLAGVNEFYLEKLQQKIKSLSEDGKTILMIEHRTDFIGQVAEKILFLYEGSLLDFDSIENLKADERVLETYIS